jgi:hypothetical protein
MKNKPSPQKQETRYLFLDQNSHWWYVSDKKKDLKERETKVIFKSNLEVILPMAILLGTSIALNIFMAIRLT